MSHYGYLKAAKIAPIKIETREATGYTTLTGRAQLYDDQSVWVDARLRTKIINMAMRTAGENADRETVVAALNDAAKHYNAKLVPHLITIARAMRLSTQLDKILDEMKANGTLKTFHREYARRSRLRAQHGAGYMSFAVAQKRFRSALIERLVGNHPVVDSGLITQVLDGKQP